MSFLAIESKVFDVFDTSIPDIYDALPDSKLNAVQRRVTRTATLDGNSVLVDNGATAADATFEIYLILSESAALKLRWLMMTYPELVCTTLDGCFLGVIDDFRTDTKGRIIVRFLVSRQWG